MRSIHSCLVRPIVLGFALALAACNSAGDGDSATKSEAIAPIAPPDGTQWAETVTISDKGGYIVGNPDAPLKLVEYASHTCGHCAQFSATGAQALHEKYIPTGVVSYELRNLIRDPIDLTIATLVRCGRPENMHPLADQAWASLGDIFEKIQSRGAAMDAAAKLPPEQRFIAMAETSGLTDFFAARGLSAAQARTCLADKAKIEAIAKNSQDQGSELKINGTPTFFLNGRKLEVNSWSALEPILQRAGAR